MSRIGATARAAVLGIALVVAGCGGKDDAREGPTAGSQCGEVMSAFCRQMINVCALEPSSVMSDCIDSGTEACCQDGCGAPVSSTQAEIEACVQAIESESCTEIALGTVPSLCQGVVRPTSALAQPPRQLRAEDSSPVAGVGRQFAQ